MMLRLRLVCAAAIVIAVANGALPLMAAEPPDEADSPIRVLILTGRNNHNWKETTPALRSVL